MIVIERERERVEHNQHRFISCPVATAIWKFISAVWASLCGMSKSPFQ